jgi:very-short-patch-repair endonuclease
VLMSRLLWGEGGKASGEGKNMPGLLSTTEKVSFARNLRSEESKAERRMWSLLRGRGLTSFKFRRQFPVGAYIADFCCYERRLIVELDGYPHRLRRSYDKERTVFLESQGFRVVRFWNSEVLKKVGMVLQTIRMELRHGN